MILILFSLDLYREGGLKNFTVMCTYMFCRLIWRECRCCLTSDIPECAKVTGAYGLTFRKGDISDLKDRLQQLCDDTNMILFIKSTRRIIFAAGTIGMM